MNVGLVSLTAGFYFILFIFLFKILFLEPQD